MVEAAINMVDALAASGAEMTPFLEVPCLMSSLVSFCGEDTLLKNSRELGTLEFLQTYSGHSRPDPMIRKPSVGHAVQFITSSQ